jgi:hypothetical protein
LRDARFRSFSHLYAHVLVLRIRPAFLFFSFPAPFFAFFVCAVRELVFHAAAEFVHACWERGVDVWVGVRGVMVFV